MKAYLVDPQRCSVEEIDLPDKKVEQNAEMRRLIGCKGMDHCTISDEHDQIWVDDIGLTNGRCWGWKLQGMIEPLAGRGVMVSADDAGRMRPPVVPIEWIRRDVVWLGEIVPEMTTVKEEYGARVVVTYSRVS